MQLQPLDHVGQQEGQHQEHRDVGPRGKGGTTGHVDQERRCAEQQPVDPGVDARGEVEIGRDHHQQPQQDPQREGEKNLSGHHVDLGAELQMLHREQPRCRQEGRPSPTCGALDPEPWGQSLDLGHQQAAVVDLLADRDQGLAADVPGSECRGRRPLEREPSAQGRGQHPEQEIGAGDHHGTCRERHGQSPRSCSAPGLAGRRRRQAGEDERHQNQSHSGEGGELRVEQCRLAVAFPQEVEDRVVERQRDPLLDEEHQQKWREAPEAHAGTGDRAAAKLASGDQQEEDDCRKQQAADDRWNVGRVRRAVVKLSQQSRREEAEQDQHPGQRDGNSQAGSDDSTATRRP